MNEKQRTSWPQIWPSIPNLNIQPSDGDEIESSMSTPLPIIRVYGQPGVGKTSFGLGIFPLPAGSKDTPVILFDLEQGSATFKSQYAMEYHDLSQHKAENIWLAFIEAVNNIEQNTRPVAIIDPCEDLEDAAGAWLMENPKHYGRTPGQYTNKYGQPAPLYWADLKVLLKDAVMTLTHKGVQTLVVVNHVRNKYQGNAPVANEFEPKGKDIFGKLSTLEVWLVGKGFEAPMGVIRKNRLNFLDWEGVENEMDAPVRKPVLPRVVSPFTPATIRDYLKHPRSKFTKTEMQDIDPSKLMLSDAARMSLESQLNQERLALLEKEAELAGAALKQKLLQEMKASGWFKNDVEIREAAVFVSGKGTSFDANDPDPFMIAMREYAQQTFPDRFAAKQ